ncbi:prolyl oligopeptidase family serine peptidase [Winogradskyella flava]|uniref:prolyl oligopeptidase n=1 Tax=Winogradskyella flava TaxID=1884876 RepID=A0A842ITR1_9FLAO|nr:prolyl oligopeptidase family serine peptidase [Winogradskyella flava]MBC2846155.1 S9 family peptidase [Winogradskyella flava]
MTRLFSIVLMFSVVVIGNAQRKYRYAKASKDLTTNVYFGETIEDPYQWMENPNDPRLADWLKSQKKLTDQQWKKRVNAISLSSQIASMYNNTFAEKKDHYKETVDSVKSKYQFRDKYVTSRRFPNLEYRLRGEKHYKKLVYIKDFQLDKDDHVSITDTYTNEDYDLIAIEMSHNGSDWREVYFYNLKTGEQLPDKLMNLRVGSNLFWEEDEFIYDAYDKPEKGRELLDKAKGQKLFRHKLGTWQSEDRLLYQNPDTTGTNDFRYFKLGGKLFFKHFYKVRGKTYKALSIGNILPQSFYLSKFLLYPNSKDIYVTIEAVFGDKVFLNTNWDAANGRVLAADISQLNKVVEIIPEYDILLTNVNKLGKEKIACIYSDKGKNSVLIYNLEGKLLRKIDFPEGKKLNDFYENDDDATHTDFSISSFYHPRIWYQLSLSDLTFKPAAVISVPYDAEDLETRYVTYKSKDGTDIPMYITCLKSTKLKGDNPTLMYGYGGYGFTVSPDFNESLTLWLLHGGILAVPNVRGGGAKGSEWGKAGRKLNKQNAIDDFIAGAEYLISEQYTNSDKLAINGGSHGGLLVGATITQRPELFKVAIAEAGAFDMLRFEKFTVGSVNTNANEFGSIENKEDYDNLKSYSPLHNIKEGVKYPNVLLITGAEDDRVPPFHSYKFLATLQEKASDTSLYQLYVVNGSGHGGALNTKDFSYKLLHKYSFLFDQLGIKIY